MLFLSSSSLPFFLSFVLFYGVFPCAMLFLDSMSYIKNGIYLKRRGHCGNERGTVVYGMGSRGARVDAFYYCTSNVRQLVSHTTYRQQVSTCVCYSLMVLDLFCEIYGMFREKDERNCCCQSVLVKVLPNSHTLTPET